MKDMKSRFLREFLIVIVLCVLGAYLVATYVLHRPVPLSFWIMTAVISLVTYIIHKVLADANETKRPQVFVNYFMGFLTVKLLLSAAMLLVLGLADRENLKFSAVGYFIVYALLTAVELKSLIPLVRNSGR